MIWKPFATCFSAAWLLMAAGMASAADNPAWVERFAFWAAPELRAQARVSANFKEQLTTLPVIAAVNSGNRTGSQILMDQTSSDYPNPEFYPMSAICPPETRLRKVRLTATAPWKSTGPPVLAFSEILILQANNCTAAFANAEAMSLTPRRTPADEQPEVLLMDVGLPGRSGLEALEDVIQIAPECRVVILTVFVGAENGDRQAVLPEKAGSHRFARIIPPVADGHGVRHREMIE